MISSKKSLLNNFSAFLITIKAPFILNGWVRKCIVLFKPETSDAQEPSHQVKACLINFYHQKVHNNAWNAFRFAKMKKEKTKVFNSKLRKQVRYSIVFLSRPPVSHLIQGKINLFVAKPNRLRSKQTLCVFFSNSLRFL